MFLVYLAISSLLPLDQATFSKRRQSFSFALFPIQLNFELVTKFNTLHLHSSFSRAVRFYGRKVC